MHWNWLPDENVSKTLTFKWEDIFVDQNDVVSSFFSIDPLSDVQNEWVKPRQGPKIACGG